jgi:FkbM family methyltransferase
MTLLHDTLKGSNMKDYVAKVQGRWGDCYYVKGDQFVGYSLREYGEYNPDETEYILQLADEKQGLVLDIGANIGVIAQALAYKGHHVVAFEPQVGLFDILTENLKPYPLSTTVYNTAVGSSNSTTTMPRQRYYNKGNFGGISCGSGDIIVPVATIDSLELGTVSLMKVDVEGWEEEVLRGAVSTILKDKPILYLEADREDKIPSLYRFVTEVLEYTWEHHNPRLFREENFFNNPSNVWAPMNYASYNVVCRPK